MCIRDRRNVEGEAQKQSDRNERSKRAEHVDLFVLMFFFGLGGVFKTALLEVAVGDADARHQDDEAAADHEGHVGVPAHELHHLHAGELGDERVVGDARIEVADVYKRQFLRRLGMPFRRIVGESLRKRSSVGGMILRSPAFLR